MEFVDGARPLRMGALPAEAQDEVRRLYEQLGGCRRDVRFAPGGWDLVTKDGLAVELDEQFHFTRYRAMTLRTPRLATLPWATPYLEYCAQFETAAARGGGRWTSPSTEKMFGASDQVGVFGERGSARGKQRALYDAMKDLAASVGVVRLARISIYDRVDGARVDDILYGRTTVDPQLLGVLLKARAHTPIGHGGRSSGHR